MVRDRYAGWGAEIGKTVLAGKATLSDCEKYVLKAGEPAVRSGQQEMIENLVAESVRSSN
jgi:xylose isomerase